MLQPDISIILIIVGLGFLAAFIDSVVGGGGLISIPALLSVGMAPSVALGTNKLACSFGSLTSAVRFTRARKVDLKLVGKLFPFVFVAAIGGACLAIILPPELLKPLVIVVLTFVLIYTLVKKDWGSVRSVKKFTIGKAIVFVLLMSGIGFYDGFLGGGTGSFMLFGLLMFGFDFLSAAGNTKVLNFASNVGGLVLFMFLNEVDYFYGIIMALSMIVGSYAGTMFALKKGVGYVKILFIIVTAILIVKNTYDYIMTLI